MTNQHMTEAQREYLKLLSDEAGEPFDPTWDEPTAAARIEALRARTGRGVHERNPDEPIPEAVVEDDDVIEELDEDGKLGA